MQGYPIISHLVPSYPPKRYPRIFQDIPRQHSCIGISHYKFSVLGYPGIQGYPGISRDNPSCRFSRCRHDNIAALHKFAVQPLRRYSRYDDTAASQIQPLRRYSRFADTAASRWPRSELPCHGRRCRVGLLRATAAATLGSRAPPLLRRTLTSAPPPHSVNHWHSTATATAGPPCTSSPCLLSRGSALLAPLPARPGVVHTP